jgi:N-[(2S)-2-amino-2-carboxyethyl]-L-glutamate dehydrogenase
LSDTRAETPRLLYLRRADVAELTGDSCAVYVEAVRGALALHARGRTVQPLKPYLRRNGGGHVADRIIAMPALLESERPIAGLKWIASKHDNPEKRGRERASGLIVLNDCEANFPVAVIEAGFVSGMRTAAVTVLGAEYLARRDARSVGCVGCGFIGRLQVRSLLEARPELDQVRLFDLDGTAAAALARELDREGRATIRVCESAEECVRGSDVVVASTVTERPYIELDWLRRGTFLSNISLMDVCDDVFVQADKVVVDDWEQCNREGKPIHRLTEAGLFSRDRLHAELGEIVLGEKPGRESEDEIVLLNPMGLAIEDVAAAQAVYERALERGAGTWLDLY